MKAPVNRLNRNAETPLASLGIKHLAVVLDEFFYVPPPGLFPDAPPRPGTIGELALRSQLDVDGVVRYLERILAMEADLEITSKELAALLASAPAGQKPLLLDVREEWEFETARIAGSVLITAEEFPAVLAGLKASTLEIPVVAICHHGVRSYSAAMYLRDQGVTKARSLAGGVAAWASEIDAGIGSY